MSTRFFEKIDPLVHESPGEESSGSSQKDGEPSLGLSPQGLMLSLDSALMAPVALVSRRFSLRERSMGILENGTLLPRLQPVTVLH